MGQELLKITAALVRITTAAGHIPATTLLARAIMGGIHRLNGVSRGWIIPETAKY
jgi:hypothetical protein